MIVAHANHLVASGHDVCIISAVFDTVFTLDPRITCDYLPSVSKAATVLSALKTKFNADLIIADIIPMACFLFPRNRKKVIYFAQDYDESYYSSMFQKLFLRCLYFLGLTLFRIRSIAVALPLAELLYNNFGADVTVVENGVNTTVFFADPDLKLLALKESRKALLLLSRTDYRKGFDVAQQTIEQLKEKITVPFEIWTVGEPAQELFPGLIHRDFGYVGETELRSILSSADLFLYPTRHEGLPLMPLEAMASGCPVIVSDASLAIAQHGINSIVILQEDPMLYADEVCSLLSDHDLCSRLVAGGLKTADAHSLKGAQHKFEYILLGWVAAR